MVLKITSFSLLILFAINIFAQEEMPEIIHIGDKAPHFSVETLDKKSFDTKDLNGKVIYLNFFATWCGPCMKEMPHIENEIWKAINHDDFEMLVIGREHTEREIKKLVKRKQFTMPMAADPNRAIYSMFAPQIIPRNIIIDKNGKIIYSKHGYDPKEFAAMIELIKKSLN